MLECQLKNDTIKYKTYGEGHPIIVLHGSGPNDHQYMRNDFEPLFEQRTGWQRIYIDLPGHGQTEWPQWVTSPDQIIDMLCEFIDQVIPGKNFTLAGFSWGGQLSLGIVDRLAEIVEGLFLFAPAVVAEMSKRNLPEQVTLVGDPSFVSKLQDDEKWITDYLVVQDHSFLDRLGKEIFEVSRKNDKLGTNQDVRGAKFTYNAKQVLLDKPTLILTGRQDRVVGYQDVLDLIENFPRATFAVLDRAGHFLSLEQQALIHTLVNEWLDRVDESRGV